MVGEVFIEIDVGVSVFAAGSKANASPPAEIFKCVCHPRWNVQKGKAFEMAVTAFDKFAGKAMQWLKESRYRLRHALSGA
jgi:hypothetical protein